MTNGSQGATLPREHRGGGVTVRNGRRGTAEERGTELVRRVVEEIWNKGDIGLADMLFTPTYVNHGGLIPDLVFGPEAIKVSVAMYRTAFPEFHITMEALRATGEIVDLQWTAHRDQVAPEDRGGVLHGTIRGRIATDQIAESWTTWDHEHILRYLGIFPPPDGHIRDAPRRA